jgi:hypothetical protein
MVRMARWVAAASAALVLAATLAVCAPEPRTVPTEWQLDIRVQAPQPIRMKLPGEKDEQTFWYVLYTVTNKTGGDRMFVPRFSLYTDTGEILEGTNGASPTVFAAIKKRHGNPLLQTATGVTGLLLQGADNAKDGVAIFRDIDPTARSFDLFVGGLSGETAVEKLPTKVMVAQVDVEGKTTQVLSDTIVLRKTMDLAYKFPGDAGARTGDTAALESTTWVMR